MYLNNSTFYSSHSIDQDLEQSFSQMFEWDVWKPIFIFQIKTESDHVAGDGDNNAAADRWQRAGLPG